MANNLSPFDLLNYFHDDKKWNIVTKLEKNKNFFIINRLMSINYPIPASLFSFIRMPGHIVVEFWKKFIGRNFKKNPDWLYTKGKSNIKKDTIDSFSEEITDYYMKINECDYKVFNELKKKFPNELMSELLNIEKMISSYTKKPEKIKKSK